MIERKRISVCRVQNRGRARNCDEEASVCVFIEKDAVFLCVVLDSCEQYHPSGSETTLEIVAELSGI